MHSRKTCRHQTQFQQIFCHKLHIIIAYFANLESSFLHGKVEVDESYFGNIRKGKIYAQMISDIRERY